MILNVNNIRGPVDHISDLEIIGDYSINCEREYCSGIKQLKYYKKPLNSRNVNFNLNLNENTIHRINKDDKLNYILTWILDNFDSLKVQDSEDITQWIQPQFVTFRGTLKSLLITPYERYNGWIICASKFKGTIYLCSFDTEEKKRRELFKTNYERLCTDWGYKFEQYMLADTPDNEPNTSECLNQNEEFCCVFKSKFGQDTLLYAAELDGICSKQIIKDTIVGKKCELVELKTIRQHLISNNGPRNIFKKLLWWTQCYPAGIEKIVCGCKDTKGFVREIKEVMTSTFRIKVEEDRCKSFCSGFLKKVKTIVHEDYDKCLYKFTYSPQKRTITVDKMKPDNESEYMFLYSWYIDNIKTKYENKK
ncbi:decapping and exoribonuclease protein-like isoform X1 [Frieseomelitta varia]|uniref:decapping and exoribonuclease protein-like isoform X1 n=1 Tax=Frieseomelitta varia TaxID=561572 RepID=UPI001CB6B2C1|nr:decapping and exoribonuclease protein-like isoform X1 [Frieseomelitta varia]